MKFYVGDKVKFLNEKGEGIVKKILSSTIILVTIEDGFDIPVLATELIRDNLAAAEEAGRTERNIPAPAPEPELSSKTDEKLSQQAIQSRKSEDVFLAFIPHDQRGLVNGPLEVIMINNTTGDILYNLYRKNPEGGFSGVDYGSVASESKITLAEIDREELPQWIEGNFQFLFHLSESQELPLPGNAEYALQGKKFFTESNYHESKYFRGKGIYIRIASLEKEKPIPQILSAEPVPSAKQALASDDFIFRHKTREREAEVDLHINEIIEDPGALDKSEILDYQKKYFIRCLDSAIVNHFRKVIFIHGVGNGVLREVLLDYLLQQKSFEVFDAPMHKYGVGAVEVRIPHNL
jgi:hypothetical protein